MLAVTDGPAAAVRQWLHSAAARLQWAGVDTPRLDAELIAAQVLGVDRARLLSGSYELTPEIAARMESLLCRRIAREPLAYIAGRKEFFSLDLEVTPAVLIPRPETELVVEAALRSLAHRPRARVLDLCTGSGAIAIAIAVNCPGATVVATDISAAALEVGRRNAAELKCAGRIDFRRGDMFDALPAASACGGGAEPAPFDLIVSNPPYIPLSEMAGLAPEISRYEPAIALAAGEDGLEFYRRIARRAPVFLGGDGEVIVEVGAHQAAAVAALLIAAGFGAVTRLCDLAGYQRVVCASAGQVGNSAV